MVTTCKRNLLLIFRTLCLSWLLLCFILGAGYGSNLRAIILKPQKEAPIDTFDELLSSGLPWRMMMFGGYLEKNARENGPPEVRKIMEETVETPLSSIYVDIVSKCNINMASILHEHLFRSMESLEETSFSSPPSDL